MDSTWTPTFTCTLRLRPHPGQVKKLNSRFEIARQFYNSALRECLNRIRSARQTREWRQARSMQRSVESKSIFCGLRKRYGLFGKRPLQKWVSETIGVGSKGAWIREQLQLKVCRNLSERAWKAAQVSFSGRKPKFKRPGDLGSVQGELDEAIRWTGCGVTWNGMSIQADIDTSDPVVEHSLKHRIKACRILRREIRGESVFFAQLILEGTPYIPPDKKLGKGVVGIDLGPTIIAIVSEMAAFKTRLCDELESVHCEVRRHQKNACRRLQQANPDAFELTKSGKKKLRRGARLSNRTNSYKRSRAAANEASRREGMYRKVLHGNLIRRIIAMGDTFILEDISYKSWQRNRMFAKSVGFRSPGMFVQLLKMAVAKLGGTVIECNTRTTSLTASCHCGRKERKALGNRYHVCQCQTAEENNKGIDRDIHSAFLARFVKNDALDVAAAQKAWPGVSKLLIAASRECNRVERKRYATAGGRSESPKNLLRCSAGLTPLTASDPWVLEKARDVGGQSFDRLLQESVDVYCNY